jgi:hypothetical protein
MGRILGALVMLTVAIWISRMPRSRRWPWKKSAKAPAYEERWKDAMAVQTYEQLRRHRDSLWIVLAVIIATEGLLWQPGASLSALRGWAETVLLGGMIAVFVLAWLVLYLLDRQKAAGNESRK